MKYHAHSKKNCPKKDWQLLKEHLEKTAEKAETFGKQFNAGEMAKYAGLFHDLGKYTEAFQKRLDGGKRVDHSTAGAKEVFGRYNHIGKLLAYCIAGHHGGLPNYGTVNDEDSPLEKRLGKTGIENYDAYKADLGDSVPTKIPALPPLKMDKKNAGFVCSFLTRMIYSCLVDADYLDTEDFMEEQILQRGGHDSLEVLHKKLMKKLETFRADTELNKKRGAILQQCIDKSSGEKGFYSLSVPTGGGKTFSSMAFALSHALKNEQNRVIYAIPYTSIIEQNADEFRKVFEDKNILEHHSTFTFEEKENDENTQEVSKKLKLAAENWDIPIVATTNVQFFESLFANRSSRCRKLHNIANSVIILDEAQMIPLEFIKPCMWALTELVNNYGCTVVFCTATQPSLGELMPEDVEITEIMDNPIQLYKDFQRVTVESIGKKSDDELAEDFNRENRFLCIVNTRRHARELFEKLGDDENKFHLSTLMCPIHRKQTLKTIKKRLKDAQACKVISTQLIEAGVDIDFPLVYRSSAGLDSIAQSAGRCNREGKLAGKGIVKVFDSTEKHCETHGFLNRTASSGRSAMRKYPEEILSPEAIKYYFENLYTFEGEESFDKKNILEFLNNPDLEYSFKSAAKDFNFIENGQRSIIIPFDDKAKSLIQQAKESDFPTKFARQLHPYTVNVYEHEYEALEKAGVLRPIGEDTFTQLVEEFGFYDDQVGLKIPDGSEALII